MKDSYSFDVDWDGLDRQFEAHRKAYNRIFERLGLAAFPGRGVERGDGWQHLNGVHGPLLSR